MRWAVSVSCQDNSGNLCKVRLSWINSSYRADTPGWSLLLQDGSVLMRLSLFSRIKGTGTGGLKSPSSIMSALRLER